MVEFVGSNNFFYNRKKSHGSLKWIPEIGHSVLCQPMDDQLVNNMHSVHFDAQRIDLIAVHLTWGDDIEIKPIWICWDDVAMLLKELLLYN